MRPEIENILDMGTGSGAIGLILAKKTQKSIVCTDISLGALLVARQNRENFKLSGQTHLICSDLFDALGNVEFDMILANLPYIASEEWDSLMTDVKDYEPRTALDGGKEGIAIYKRFVEGLPQHLTKKGYVLCEVGSSEQARKMQEMLLAIGLTVVVKKDLSGLERVLVGSWTSL
jgi:release factor glutamine methyltransferase